MNTQTIILPNMTQVRVTVFNGVIAPPPLPGFKRRMTKIVEEGKSKCGYVVDEEVSCVSRHAKPDDS